ncbi:MAG TPA: hypothetical protein VF618_02740 [Thermoanaerobaculia bacterium]
MGLISAEIERHGIPTVCIVLLRDVAVTVKPPRALWVPFPHGYPLGKPHDAQQQRDVLLAALALLERAGPPPLLVDLQDR